MRAFNEKSIVLICVLFTISSFIFAQPEKNQGENVLKVQISRDSKIQLTIKNFTKTNGIMREVLGQPIYTMEFTAKIQIDQKCGTLRGFYLKDFMPFEEFENYINNIYYAKSNKTIFYPAACINYDGEVTFEKTERGWRSTDCKLTGYKIISNDLPLSEYTAVGTIKNFKLVDGVIFLYMLSTKSQEVIIEINDPDQIEFNGSLSEILKVGVKIAVIGQFKDSTLEIGKLGLVPKKIIRL